MISRAQLDASYGACIRSPRDYGTDSHGEYLIVNGAMGRYLLYVPVEDKSILPCLTGDVGGMVGAWENWITAWHINNLNKYNFYVDIGANVGYYGLLAGTYGLGVLAFEPQEKLAWGIRESIIDNHMQQVVVVEAALGDEQKEVHLNTYGDLFGSADVDSERPGGIWQYRLDDFVEDFPTSYTVINGNDEFISKYTPKVLIKMDVEGHEEKVFDGAENINKEYRPDYVLEYTPGRYSENFYDKLESYGNVYMIDYDGFERKTSKQEVESATDWITLFVKSK